MTPAMGWDQAGDDFYIWLDSALCDLSQAASAVASYRVTGQTRTIVPDLVTYGGYPRLRVTVGQQALPNGVEVEFWVGVTMQDNSVVRVPETGTISIRVYR